VVLTVSDNRRNSLPEVRWIRTETPEVEQWRQLGQFRYSPNVRRYLNEHGLQPSPSGIEDYISGSVGQAEEYFRAAKIAPLDISPLLLYYGATSLLTGASALIRGYPLSINQHGMAISVPAGATRMSDVQVVVRNTSGGALREIAQVFGDPGDLPGQSRWSVGELLASLPDLKDDVRLCIPAVETYALRIDTIRKDLVDVDRIALGEFGTANIDTTLTRVVGFSHAYLSPQRVSEAIVLHRKFGVRPIGTESLSGQKVLQVAHDKSGVLCTPSQILAMLMALFALGFESRYNPTLWHPFAQTDATGERLLVERFLALTIRLLPSLVLSSVSQTWTRFTSEVIRPPRGLESLSEAELRSAVKEMVAEALR
jgi:hypothetical protein